MPTPALQPTFDLVGGPLLTALLGVLLLVESLRPLRQRVQSRWRRMRVNFGLAAVGMAGVRLAFVPAVVATAAWAGARDFGLLRLFEGPAVVEIALAVVVFDYTVYGWHRLNHRVPLLWRFHGVHHTDLDLDVTTGFRFHVGELLLSVLFRCAMVALLGVEPVVALAYEVALEAATEFHHSNWRLPLGLERFLHAFLVTPRMHGIHHSIVERETDSNFSVIFPWWDRLHRSLRLGLRQDELTIGLPAYRAPDELTFLRLLAMPFLPQRPSWILPDGTRPDRESRGDRPLLP